MYKFPNDVPIKSLEKFRQEFKLIRKLRNHPFFYIILQYNDDGSRSILRSEYSQECIGTNIDDMDKFEKMHIAPIYKMIDATASEIAFRMAYNKIKNHLLNSSYNFVYPIEAPKFKNLLGVYVNRDTRLNRIKIGKEIYNAEIMIFEVIDFFDGYNYPSLPRFFNLHKNEIYEESTIELRKKLAEKLNEKLNIPENHMAAIKYGKKIPGSLSNTIKHLNNNKIFYGKIGQPDLKHFVKIVFKPRFDGYIKQLKDDGI